MNRKILLLTVFILVAVAQLLVPKHMISNLAGFAKTGKEYKFKIRHQRSDSPERGNSGSSIQGRFIWLQFEESRYRGADTADLNLSKPIYVLLSSDSLGFAKIQSVMQNKPQTGSDWLKVRAYKNFRDSDTSSLIINFPFNSYIIEDKDIKDTELGLTRKLKDPQSLIYLKVNIKESKYLVNDLVIDGLSFKDFVKSIRGTRQE
jgi:hypothetical protein